MPADNTAHLRAAARERAERTLARAAEAMERLAAEGQPMSVARVAAAARVSRSWLYTQPQLLERIAALADRRPPARREATPAPERASTASLRRRLELAHQRIGQLTDENKRLREELERAYGQLRAEGAIGDAKPDDSPPTPEGA